jgi:ferredoxin-NADP reductase
MSRWLFDHALVGTVLELENSFGDMTADTFTGQPLVLLAAGSGITPLMALLREQALLGMPCQTTLVYWARTEDLLCFQRDINDLVSEFENFTSHTVITSEGTGQRINSAQLNILEVMPTGSQVLACGGSEFVEHARQCTTTADSFLAEAFTPPKRLSEGEAEQSYTVELLGGRSIEVSNQQTLLDALEQEGVSVTTGCRMGICNTCSCTKTSGNTQDINSKVMSADANTQIRLCVTRATSHLRLAI